MSAAPLSRALLAVAVSLAPVAARAAPAPSAKPERSKGSLVTAAPLGKGRTAMLLGGGVAVLLPFYEIEVGRGVAERLDLLARFETVVGLLHFSHLGVRWSPFDIGQWKLGVSAGMNYSFFGIATDQVNLTSTFYLTAELGISGPITPSTDLVFAVNNEVDLFYYKRIDGEDTLQGTFRYDAAVLRTGVRTRLAEDLDAFVLGRLRVPVETLEHRAMSFYVMPFLEIGGAWAW